MKVNRLVLVILLFLTAGILLACAETPSPETPSPIDTATSTLLPPTEEPSPLPSPTAITPEPEQTTAPAYTPEKQPAAPPHFNYGVEMRLDYIKMINEKDGWGISGPLILITHDGGNSWREVTPPQSLPDGIHSIAYGAFTDELSAWVVFGFDDSDAEDRQYANYQVSPEASVWSTFDGGRTWTSSPPLMHEIYGDATWAEFASVDDTTGWMMIRGVYVGAGTHYIAQLFQTVDGITWIPIPGGDIGVDYTGMVFADEDTGWLTWQTTGAYAAAPPEVGLTTDSGYNWDVMDLPPPDDAPNLFTDYEYCEPYSPNMLSPQSIRLLVACFGYTGTPSDTVRYIYSSDDMGDSWDIFPAPAMPNSNEATLIFFDEENALLLGHDMFQSEDGGETWQPVKTVNWDGQFSFVDDQNGWAVARSADGEIALVQTVNGGQTWTQLKPVTAP